MSSEPFPLTVIFLVPIVPYPKMPGTNDRISRILNTQRLLLSFHSTYKSNNRILIIIKGSRLLEEEIRKAIFDYFPVAPQLKVKNSTVDKVEMIYEINKKMLDKAQKIETDKALGEQRDNRTILDILYSLGDIDYTNIVVQNDEIT